MEASSIASPLCPWLVAARISPACEKDHPLNSSMFQSPKRLSQWSRRKKLIPKCSNGNGGFSASSLLSSFCTFEPCVKEYYSSKGLYASLAVFGENAFLLSGSKIASITTRRNNRLKACDAHSGKTAAVESSEEEAKKALTRQRKVVVTGLAVVSSIGHDPDVFYTNLLEGVSGISEIEAFDCSTFPSSQSNKLLNLRMRIHHWFRPFSQRIAGEIKSFSTEELVSPKVSKRADKFMLYLLTAGKKALTDGGITEEVMRELDKNRCGVLIGSALGGMSVSTDAIEALRISYKKINPFTVPFATTNMGSAILAIDLGWMGPNYSISTACATSNICILNAAYHIIRGDADMMLCGGSDAGIIPIAFGGFLACKVLSKRNDEPTKASRPWDINRDGFVLGEGAGVLLLEELEHAKRRGATIYAELLGGSFTCDASHCSDQPQPDGRGIALCMERALAQCGVARENVNYINAHAVSSPAGDLNEYRAITRCFGKNPELRVNSTKSMIGHLLGASGAVEAVATVKAIQTGLVHPNINLENPDKGVDMNILTGTKKERLDIKIALSNSFGFSGQNSSIVFAPYK
ncbi:Polyketide synthase, beta-ketoacyl synthase domain containing protein [Trema orientale]|uniref:beta-ketoacyl-[acyl-carrier-protein] synthase I n=1 Tax=Trema orientale TaxID=63057 RepID=A0A2P5F6S0_TREOI|nr:Polyketide synthase, beta-ketoacyl synthase domain containing protein [Trema orientale]